MTIYAKNVCNDYGQLNTEFLASVSLLDPVQSLIARATKSRKIPRAFDAFDRERKGFSGSAVHIEIYDVNPTASRALVCIRESEGTKYGVATTSKRYVVIAKHGAGIQILPANKALAARAAKAAVSLGEAIKIALAVRKSNAQLNA